MAVMADILRSVVRMHKMAPKFKALVHQDYGRLVACGRRRRLQIGCMCIKILSPTDRRTKRHPPICGRWNQEMIHFYSKQSAFTNRNLRFDVWNFALHLFISSRECFDGLNPFDNDFNTIHEIGFAWAFRIHESERQALDIKPGIYSWKHKTLGRSPNQKPEIYWKLKLLPIVWKHQ